MVDREAIQTKLFNQVRTLVGASANFYSRRYIEWDDVEQDQQPAILVVAIGDRLERVDPELPPKHHLRAMIIIYTRDDEGQDPDTTPETALFALVAQVEDALKFQPGDGETPGALFTALVDSSPSTTLGGVVQHTWISDMQFHQGAGSGQCGATLVVDMLTLDS